MSSNEELHQQQIAALLAEMEYRNRYKKLETMYLPEGPFARTFYVPHWKFVVATKNHRFCALIAANRVGKSELGSWLASLHATGLYPKDYPGKRISWPKRRPLTIWVAGTTSHKVIDSIQKKLLGPDSDIGSGMIPKDCLSKKYPMRSWMNTAGGKSHIYVDHFDENGKQDGVTILVQKSYDQGRENFQAEDVDFIWLDEAPPVAVYSECATRFAVSEGQMVLTFTPLNNADDVYTKFVPDIELPPDGLSQGTRFAICCDWKIHLPHLTEKMKEELRKEYAPWEMDARTRGVACTGAGAVYPVRWDDILCDGFSPPSHWPRVCGFDPKFKRTAACWFALDPQSDTMYQYDEYAQGGVPDAVHIEALIARGAWIPIISDTSINTTSATDAQNQLQLYQARGLRIFKADKTHVSGVVATLNRLATGRYRIMRHCKNTLKELMRLQYDVEGKIVKSRTESNDDLADCVRYVMLKGKEVARTMPKDEWEEESGYDAFWNRSTRDKITGA